MINTHFLSPFAFAFLPRLVDGLPLNYFHLDHYQYCGRQRLTIIEKSLQKPSATESRGIQ